MTNSRDEPASAPELPFFGEVAGKAFKEIIAEQRAQSISDVEQDKALMEALETFRTFLW